jgi:hypothetical protein
MRSIICAAALALAITTAGAEEDSWSANFVLRGCNPEANQFLWGRCLGMVEGLAFTWCARIPKGVTKVQTVRVVVR